jgi:hypothetical protein
VAFSLMSPTSSREYYLLFLGVAIPYLGRSLETLLGRKLFGWFCDRAYGEGQNPLDDVLLAGEATSALSSAKEVSIDAIMGGHSGPRWESAVAMLGWSQRKAWTVALIRLVFWHWMQPAMYAWTLYSYSDLIDYTQLVLGVVVLGREGLYVLFTCIALYRNPVFLLANVAANRDNKHVGTSSYYAEFLNDVIWFVFVPEKYVARCALIDNRPPHRYITYQTPPPGAGPCDCAQFLAIAVFCCCDICGIAALVVGALHYLPLPLAIGYTVTTLGGLASVVMLFNYICIAISAD